MPEQSTIIVGRPSASRSAVSNGSKLVVGIDGRSAPARRLKDVIDQLLVEIARAPSEADLMNARNAAALQLHAERLDASLLRGEAVSGAERATVANSMARALADLGLTKRHRRGPVRFAHISGPAAADEVPS